MKRLLHTFSGSLIIISAVCATHFHLAAAEKEQKGRSATVYTQSEFELTSERMKFIDEVLENAIKRNLDVTSESTILLLETEISRKMPLTPKIPVSNKGISQFAAEARKQVRDDASYAAERTKLRANAEKEALEKYPLAKPRTKVKFQYKKGPYIETVDGTFYMAFERYVQIDGKRIPFMDLPDEQRAMFDRKFNAEKRKEYVDQKIKDLEIQKNLEIQKMFTELLAGQDLRNEKNGYLYDKSQRKWITAKDYLQSKLPAAIEKYQVYLKEQQERERIAKERAEIRVSQNTKGKTGSDTSDPEKYKKILADAKAKRQKLELEFSGVDAYQGFRNALWGASREEVAYLFSKVTGARYERIDFDSKLTLQRYSPAEVFFKFAQNKLVMVTLSYGYAVQVKNNEKTEIQRIFSSNDFNSLIITLHDICGLSEEEKLADNRNLFKEIASGKLTPEKLHPPKDVKDAKDAKAEPVKSFFFTWIGQETDMTLSFGYDPEKDVYQDVQLTKKKKKY